MLRRGFCFRSPHRLVAGHGRRARPDAVAIEKQTPGPLQARCLFLSPARAIEPGNAVNPCYMPRPGLSLARRRGQAEEACGVFGRLKAAKRYARTASGTKLSLSPCLLRLAATRITQYRSSFLVARLLQPSIALLSPHGTKLSLSPCLPRVNAALSPAASARSFALRRGYVTAWGEVSAAHAGRLAAGVKAKRAGRGYLWLGGGGKQKKLVMSLAG